MMRKVISGGFFGLLVVMTAAQIPFCPLEKDGNRCRSQR